MQFSAMHEEVSCNNACAAVLVADAASFSEEIWGLSEFSIPCHFYPVNLSSSSPTLYRNPSTQDSKQTR